MQNLKTHSIAARKTVIAIAVAILVLGVSPVVHAEGEDAAALNIPGKQNDVTTRLNAAAAYASSARLESLNSLYRKPVKQRLQDMTCLQKIMNIKFTGFSTFSLSAMFDALIEAAISALLGAACSYVDNAWDSGMGKLTEMTTVDMGKAGNASVGSIGNSLGPVYHNNNSNPYISGGMRALTTPGVNPDYGGFKAPGAQGDASASSGGFGGTLSAGWEATKNLFK